MAQPIILWRSLIVGALALSLSAFASMQAEAADPQPVADTAPNAPEDVRIANLPTLSTDLPATNPSAIDDPNAFTPPLPRTYSAPNVAESPPSTSFVPAEDASVLSLTEFESRYEMLAGGGMGMDSIDGSATLKFRNVEEISIKPMANLLFVDGPTVTDLPPRLYSGQLEFRWFDRIGEPFFYELAVLPGIFSDGDAMNREAVRIQGRAVGFLAFSEQTQLALGFSYLDREDVPVLPIAGLIHSPRDDIRLEIMFPRPKLAKRIADDSDGETWAYVMGEFGGGSWAIERAKRNRQTRSFDDVVNYRDYRLIAGIERKLASGGAGHIEMGYVFNRELTYDSGVGDYDPDGTFLVRCGLSR